MAAKDFPTSQRLRELFHYDPDSGVFVRRVRTSPKAPAGSIAGTKAVNTYVLICVDGVQFFAHRLAWCYVHGNEPAQVIDHIDGNPANNRIDNLRDVAQSVNVENKTTTRSDNSSGVTGVTFVPHAGRYRARIRVRGQRIEIGYFDTSKEAGAAYLLAKKRLHEGWVPSEPLPDPSTCVLKRRGDVKKLPADRLECVRKDIAAGGTQRDIAARHGISGGMVSMIKHGKRNAGR